MIEDKTQQYVPTTSVEEAALAAFLDLPSHRRLYADAVLPAVLGAVRAALGQPNILNAPEGMEYDEAAGWLQGFNDAAALLDRGA